MSEINTILDEYIDKHNLKESPDSIKALSWGFFAGQEFATRNTTGAAPTSKDWISLKDDKPAIGELVVVYGGGKFPFIDISMLMERNGNLIWCWGDTAMSLDTVTLWHPITHLPEKEKHENT